VCLCVCACVKPFKAETISAIPMKRTDARNSAIQGIDSSTSVELIRVGQSRIYAPYMTV
jgi:hypothetical protein